MGHFLIKAPEFSRPADTTAYADGDLVANSTTAGSVVPLVFSGLPQELVIHGGSIYSTNDTITNRSLELFLFSTSPTVTNGDNGAFAVTAANAKTLRTILGSTLAKATGGGGFQRLLPMDGAGTFLPGAPAMVFSGTLYGLIKARAAYTPASAETFNVSLHVSTTY